MPRVFSLPSSRPHLKLDVKFTVGLPTSLFSHLLDRAGPLLPPFALYWHFRDCGDVRIYLLSGGLTYPPSCNEAYTWTRDPYMDTRADFIAPGCLDRDCVNVDRLVRLR
ncbi:hypothetical protein QQF64_022346 [Cirrhinus molitorella]|uniref:Uncharacterized protein n=1 Tax=Cirrhinus molitorella TaxID=172907 RepID=A0ABR3L883_9TELE